MKICPKCKLFKKLSEFDKNKKYKDGLQSWRKSGMEEKELKIILKMLTK